MSDKKTKTQPQCKDGVCILLPLTKKKNVACETKCEVTPGDKAVCVAPIDKAKCEAACANRAPDNVCENNENAVAEEAGPQMEMPDLQSVFASSFQNIQRLISQSLVEQQGKVEKKKRRRRSHSDDEDDSEDDSEDDTDSDSDDSSTDSDDDLPYRTIPDYKWAALHQLLDSHNALCAAFVRLVNQDDDDEEDD